MRLPPYNNGGTLTLSRVTILGRKELQEMNEPPQANRPMVADAQRRDASLFKVARLAFSERNANIVLEELARSAGMPIGTIYPHFPTCKDLLEAVYLNETNDI